MDKLKTPHIKIKKYKDQAILPTKRKEDAAYDFYGIFENEFEILNQSEIKLYSTGLGMEIPHDWVLQFNERGSTGIKGISKRAGIIDSGFRGEIFIILQNTSTKKILFTNQPQEKINKYLTSNNLKEKEITIYPQSKAIIQGLFLYCPHVTFKQVNELNNNSQRKNGSFGSSKK